MSSWFGELPAKARGGLIVGGTLMGAFSGKFPEALQAAGLYIGVAVAAYGVAATIWHWLSECRSRMGVAQTILLISLILLGVGSVGAVTAGAWILVKGTQSLDTKSAEGEGPLSWLAGIGMSGDLEKEVRRITFTGVNTSSKEVELESADITSAIDGTRKPLLIAVSDGEKRELVNIDEAGLIPPGARVELVARFDPPAQTREFLERWRQFFFNVENNVNTFRRKFDETTMMLFFEGMVGPRVTRKPGPKIDPEIANDPYNRD